MSITLKSVPGTNKYYAMMVNIVLNGKTREFVGVRTHLTIIYRLRNNHCTMLSLRVV